ncbi:MAG: Protein of unknown function (DUF2815) [Glomeribacter sp. 1016415]|uniref:Bbp40 protein n=1 Tax=Mycoavidus cysteinexigens TaxID=1553431 RepID=A0A2Z6EWJ9_9BURK|nr:DUF2815 family protein [Mycoavidus cysteinexigens]MCX8567038.1 Protein of unknown function (DUF2815) [Glomeribacter sp. 1016415]BBE09811.1 Bbp40 protein [Mycoavidus cysteinexigens]GAM53845.1 phage protein [bacterium endosymbiont of Mortierella elongata FMR23-6]GLR01712.1 hypothetical protein GCM10007934_15240 [Mycoavidus cysteinexigens]
MKLKLNNVRLAFPALFEAKTVNGEGKPSFSAVFLISKHDPQVKIIMQAFDITAKEKWGAKAESILKQLRNQDKTALHDGDSDSKKDYDGFEGNLYLSARNSARPLVLDLDKTPLVEMEGRPYAGCYVNASVELWAQDNNYGKRINATLRGVQFFAEGDAFTGGGCASEEEFDDLSVDTNIEDLVPLMKAAA